MPNCIGINLTGGGPIYLGTCNFKPASR
jgi:hypothetical protein